MLSQLFLFLSVLSFVVHSLPAACQSPGVKDKAVKCVDQLTPMFAQVKAAQNSGWVTLDAASSVNDMCSISLDCFKTLQTCAGIDQNLILTMEGVCDLFGFMTGKFSDCTQKMETLKNNKCVVDFFTNPVYTDAPDNKTRCNKLKEDGKCVEKKTESACSKGSAKDFSDHLDGQLKRFNC
ncbi:unnamed protein product [Caenorhabditis sp. 36 PRJEB53466]|nr:unnamed protein product [Caenorhabditis sp. 36 PRJEB53466]